MKEKLKAGKKDKHTGKMWISIMKYDVDREQYVMVDQLQVCSKKEAEETTKIKGWIK